MKRPLTRLSYANVVATLALFAALGGSAWALTRNTVGSPQLKKGAVKASDLAGNAVRSSKVANGSLLGEDFAPGQLPGAALPVPSRSLSLPLRPTERAPAWMPTHSTARTLLPSSRSGFAAAALPGPIPNRRWSQAP